MRTALIGHTGFVGGSLSRQREFDCLYNSQNVYEMEGTYDLVVCAGAPGVKWFANANPARDNQSVGKLMDALTQIVAQRFILVSTVDVYGAPVKVTEFDEPHPKDIYGANRLSLERFVARHFPVHTIVRLPALFGDGLRKNALFDLMHNQQTPEIASNALYQWFPIGRFFEKLREVSVMNLVTEPIDMAYIRWMFFQNRVIGAPKKNAPHYDVRSTYARSGYHLTARSVLHDMERFLCLSGGS